MTEGDDRRKALLTPLELALSAIMRAVRAALETFGDVMFRRGMLYEKRRAEKERQAQAERERALKLGSGTLPAAKVEEYDPDKTPTRWGQKR